MGWPWAPASEVTNPHGFNLGANAILGYTCVTAQCAVLNIDASGNPSQIYGTLWPNSMGGGNTPAVFLANANGIIVGTSGRIVASAGVGLIGANLNNPTSINDFVGNNGWVAPAAPSYGTSFVGFGTVPTTGNVTIAGKINGDLALNKEALYIIVAGNIVDVLNTGSLFGRTVLLSAGLVATPTAASVGGASGQTVNRLWNVDAGVEQACCAVGPLPGNLSLAAGATGNVVNEGSIAAVNGVVDREWISIQAKGSVRSGIQGDSNPLVGLFSDRGIEIDLYSNTGRVALYNAVSGYTSNKSLNGMVVNRNAVNSGFAPDVVIDALTPGSQASSVASVNGIVIFGGNVDIRSTINHRSKADGGIQSDEGLYITASNSVTIGAAVGGVGNVEIESGGPLTIAGNVLANTDGMFGGGILVENAGAGAPTTISGNMTVLGPQTDDVEVFTRGPTTISGNLAGPGNVFVGNYGLKPGNRTTISGNIAAGHVVTILNGTSPTNVPLTISGSVVATDNVLIYNYGASAGNTTTISGNVTSVGGNVVVAHYGLPSGSLTVTGSLSAMYDVSVFSDGHAWIGSLAAGRDVLATVLGTGLTLDGPWTAGNAIDLFSPLALARLTPAAVLTAPSATLEGLSFTGVNLGGAPYANLGQKPAAQIVTNDLEVTLTGSINGPVASNTNWLLNSMDVAPLATLAPVFVSVTAGGSGFQAVNLHVHGDAIVDSGATRTPFVGVPLTTGGLPAGGIQGNLGSQLILQADGYMQVWGTPTLTLFGPPLAFQWPGGAVFRAGTTLQTFAPVYNAWSTASPPFGGLFFEAPYTALGGYLAVSGTAWANFSSRPVTGDPAVYQIRQVAPNAFAFAATTAFVKNAYSNTVTGGTVCTTTGPSTWMACP